MRTTRRFFLALLSALGISSLGCKKPSNPHEVVDSQYGLTRLHVAARNGDVSELEALLLAGGDPNIEDASGAGWPRNKSPLHWAANAETVDLLVKYGADMEFPGPLGNSPLCSLAMRNRYDAVVRLVEFGAIVDGSDDLGQTPLIWCMTGLGTGFPNDALHENRHLRLKTVRFLLEHGANVNRVSEGSTALGCAVKFAPEFIPLLLEFGADPEVPDGDKTLIEWALAMNRPETAQLLEEAIRSKQNSHP